MTMPNPSIESGRTTAGARRNTAILVTGAGGEMGHGLLEVLAAERERAGGGFPARFGQERLISMASSIPVSSAVESIAE